MESWISNANKRYSGGQAQSSPSSSWAEEVNKRFPVKPTSPKKNTTKINQFGIVGKDKLDINKLFNDIYKKTTSTQEVTKPTNKEMFGGITDGIGGALDKFVDNVKSVSNRINNTINKVQKLNKDTADKLTSTVIQEVTKNGLIGMLINPESVGLKKDEANQFTLASKGIQKLGSGNKMSEGEIKSFTNVMLGIVDFGGSNLPKKSKPIIDDIVSRVSASSEEFAKTIQLINDPVFKAEGYVAEQVAKQKSASKVEGKNVGQKISDFYQLAKRKLVDFTAPIEDAVKTAEKKGKFKIVPTQDIRNQIDRVLRTPSISTSFARREGLIDVIDKVDNLSNLDQYLIAKQAVRVAQDGVETGRNLVKDRQLISAFSEKYEPFAKQVTQYSQKLLDYSAEAGLISKELAIKLKDIYPDYVPINRIFNELEKSEGFGSKAVASLSSQSIVKKLVGSEREIENPIKSLIEKTAQAFNQGEKNIAGRLLASYGKLPGGYLPMKELKAGEKALHTISYLDNGVKRTFETTKEIAEASKALNVQQLNILGQILATPVRAARIGITGVNLPFLASNVTRDAVTGFINSSNSLSRSVANPSVFVKSLFEAVGHGRVYQEMAKEGALGTSFDIARNQLPETINKLKAQKNLGSKIKYTITHPKEYLRTIENVISRGEEFNRIQQYMMAKDDALAKGMNEANATIKAAQAARENTVNFARKGEWGSVLNSTWLYLNANIQGTRTFVRALAERPGQTATKLAVAVFTPVAITTAWNLSDPKRKEAYDDIAEWEKESNMIIIPPNPTKNEDGTWNVIKIPLSQEVNSIADMVRKPVEQAYGLDKISVQDIVSAFTGTLSPVGDSKNELISSALPQAFKPTIEARANMSFYTGTPQVPQSLAKLSPELQTKKNTSGTARKVGGALNASPIKVEQFVKGTFGGVGSQVLNAIDRVLAGVNVIPDDQIGGQDLSKAIVTRFNQARGGEIDNDSNAKLQDIIQKQADTNFRLKQEAEAVLEELSKLPRDEANQKASAIEEANPQLYKKLEEAVEQKKLGLDYNDRLMMQLGVENGERAKFIFQTLQSMKTREEKNSYVEQLMSKKIISDKVYKQLEQLAQ